MTEQNNEAPVQHTPVHERGEVFDPRHPAASAFAVAQPGAGVVADDAHEKGQNLAGGPPASEAAAEYSGQIEVLEQNHERDLRVAAGQGEPQVAEKAGDKPAEPDPAKKTAAPKPSAPKDDPAK